MTPPDLATYLEFRAPADMTFSQMCNLARVRRAFDRPISMFGYEAIQYALADLERRPRPRAG